MLEMHHRQMNTKLDRSTLAREKRSNLMYLDQFTYLGSNISSTENDVNITQRKSVNYCNIETPSETQTRYSNRLKAI